MLNFKHHTMKKKYFILTLILSFFTLHFYTQTIECEKLTITSGTYSETDDLIASIQGELGNNYAITDWADLQGIADIETWISCMGFEDDQTFMLTRNGNYFYNGGNRQYYVHYSSDGIPYSGFLVHDQIGSLYLGSWYGLTMNILSKQVEQPCSGVECDNLQISCETYSETDDLIASIKGELGDNYTITDWADLQGIADIETWISCMGFEDDQTFMLTRDGDYFYNGGNRQYYVHYSSDGIPYSGFLVHDQIGSLYLGSWYGLTMNVLSKTNSSNVQNNILATGLGDINSNLQIRSIIENAGYIIHDDIRANINGNTLADMQELALFNGGQTSDGQQLLTTDQVNHIVAFVQNGGLLYISSRKGYENILNQLGVFVTGNDGGSSGFDWPLIELSATIFNTHPITEGLSSIVGDVGASFTIDTNWNLLGEDSNGTDLLAERQFGQGTVVLWYGQRSFRDPGSTGNVYETDITEGDNIEFYTNLFTFFANATLDVNTFQHIELNIYPNPVTNILTIDSEIPLTKVEIYSMLGKKVKEINSGFSSITTGNLSNGIYIVRIHSEIGFTTKKLIKK